LARQIYIEIYIYRQKLCIDLKSIHEDRQRTHVQNADPVTASASINGCGAPVNNVATAASATINGCEAVVNNVAAAVSANINGSGTTANNVAAAASASINGSETAVNNVEYTWVDKNIYRNILYIAKNCGLI